MVTRVFNKVYNCCANLGLLGVRLQPFPRLVSLKRGRLQEFREFLKISQEEQHESYESYLYAERLLHGPQSSSNSRSVMIRR